MIQRRNDYQVTANFIGLIWRGQAIVGFDLADWAWGAVWFRWYIGWYFDDNES